MPYTIGCPESEKNKIGYALTYCMHILVILRYKKVHVSPQLICKVDCRIVTKFV